MSWLVFCRTFSGQLNPPPQQAPGASSCLWLIRHCESGADFLSQLFLCWLLLPDHCMFHAITYHRDVCAPENQIPACTACLILFCADGHIAICHCHDDAPRECQPSQGAARGPAADSFCTECFSRSKFEIALVVRAKVSVVDCGLSVATAMDDY